MFNILHNRTEAPLAVCDDIQNAGRIIDALMRARDPNFPEWDDFFVRDDDGAEYLWNPSFRTVFKFTPDE